jgi:hypothetical protein
VRRDTRANLIFLGVFLALSLPGAVILFKKKLDPSTPPAFMPPATRTRLPYMSPEEAPDLQRFVPERTGEWVRRIAREHGYDGVAMADGVPVVSEGRRVQLLGSRQEGERRVGLLIWDEGVADPGAIAVATDGGAPVPVRDSAVVQVPADVRKELMIAGYPKPPRQVAWVEVVVPGKATALRVEQQFVPVFTN